MGGRLREAVEGARILPSALGEARGIPAVLPRRARAAAAGSRAARASRSAGPPERDETRQRVLALVDSIPRGRVATYGEIARWAGLPRRARLVGRFLRELRAESPLPWQRVLGARGRIRLPRGSRAAAEQRRRLRAEGVAVSADGRIDLARFGWRPDWRGG